MFGPVATKWFGVLQRHVVLNSTLTTTLARVGCDQFLFAPVQLTCFLSSMAIMEGNSPLEKLNHSFWPAYMANCMVWPFVQSANFAFVPLELRVLVVNVVSLGEFLVLKYIMSARANANTTAHRLELLLELDEQRRSVIDRYPSFLHCASLRSASIEFCLFVSLGLLVQVWVGYIFRLCWCKFAFAQVSALERSNKRIKILQNSTSR